MSCKYGGKEEQRLACRTFRAEPPAACNGNSDEHFGQPEPGDPADLVPVVGKEEDDADREQHRAAPKQQTVDETTPVRPAREFARFPHCLLDIPCRETALHGPVKNGISMIGHGIPLFLFFCFSSRESGFILVGNCKYL
jgi:hypothetical protein